MENEFLKVSVNADGTYNVFCKANMQNYTNLGYYEDGGDAGDYWQRVKPQYDRVIYSLGKEADIHLKEDGPLQTTFLCHVVMKVPAHTESLPKFASQRADTYKEVHVSTELTLKADSHMLEVKVRVSNQARDHRLRVAFPTHIEAKVSHAMGHFNVDERPIGRDYVKGLRDGEMSTLPMQNFVDLSDGKNGLAILNKELIEYEVSEDESRTLYLTLLRCMEVNICTEGRCATVETGAEGAQCLGEHTFQYAIYPHAGSWAQAEVYEATEQYLYPPRAYQISKHSKGHLPKAFSLFSIDSTAILLSSIKKALDNYGIVVRMYNTTSEHVSTRIRCFRIPDKAYLANMKEEVLEAVELEGDGSIVLEAGAHQILTILFKYRI